MDDDDEEKVLYASKREDYWHVQMINEDVSGWMILFFSRRRRRMEFVLLRTNCT